MDTRTYRIVLNPEPEGGFTAIVPILPGCITYGENLEEAKLMAKEAIELYIEVLKEKGKPVPSDDNSFEYSLSLVA